MTPNAAIGLPDETNAPRDAGSGRCRLEHQRRIRSAQSLHEAQL